MKIYLVAQNPLDSVIHRINHYPVNKCKGIQLRYPCTQRYEQLEPGRVVTSAGHTSGEPVIYLHILDSGPSVGALGQSIYVF